MKRLLEDVRRALSGVVRTPLPPGAVPSGAEVDDDLPAAFAAAFERAAGRVVRVPDREAGAAWLASEFGDRSTCRVENAPDEETIRASEVGVDCADLLIAETGTIVRSFASRAASRVSLVCPTTVFLADERDVVRDLPTALARLAPMHRTGRAYTVFITGPSRTADIEKQLVIPAHGPREVVVLLRGAQDATQR